MLDAKFFFLNMQTTLVPICSQYIISVLLLNFSSKIKKICFFTNFNEFFMIDLIAKKCYEIFLAIYSNFLLAILLLE